MPDVSVRVYLNKDKTEQSKEFKIHFTGGRTYFGKTLCYETDELSYIEWPLNREIPEPMNLLIVFVSIKTDFLHSLSGEREIGIYEDPGQFGDCRATLDTKYAGRTDDRYLVYELEARGTNPENLRKLYEAIRSGAIRPAISYRGSQGGKSRSELEQEVAKLRQENEELLAKIPIPVDRMWQNLLRMDASIEQGFLTIQGTIETLLGQKKDKHDRLSRSRWPFGFKKLLVERLETIRSLFLEGCGYAPDKK